MISALDTIVDQALALPEASRAFLAEKLLESLDQDDKAELSAAWRAEVRRRVTELDSGESATIDGQQVLDEVRARIG